MDMAGERFTRIFDPLKSCGNSAAESKFGDSHMIRIISLLFLIALPGLAGRAATTSGNNLSNGSIPNIGSSQPWRLECMVLDWGAEPAGYVFQGYLGAGIRFDNFGSGNYGIAFNPQNLSGVTGDAIRYNFSTLPTKVLYLRTMYTGPTASSDMPGYSVSAEIWDQNGVRQASPSYYMKGTGWVNVGSGVTIGAVTGGMSTGFCRVHTSLVPLNSRPPTTFDNTNRLDEWKFDGNLKNSVRAYDLAVSAGSVSYPSTLAYQGVVSKVQTVGHPIWTDQLSLRAGFPNQLDGTSSFSQSDTSSTVSYRWAQRSGPSASILDSRTTAQPLVSGLIFGSYTFRLTVTDGLTSAFTDLAAGAVATDNNDVVIHANPDVEKIFGPMIAFGKNPWAYADDTALRGVQVRTVDYVTKFNTPPEWAVSLAGTVNYNATADFASNKTTLTAGVTASSPSIPVASLTNLDLSAFPTIIAIGTPDSRGEEVLICSVSGLNLIPCYDGRGYNNSQTKGSGGPMTWVTGDKIFQRPVVGVGTNFLTDFCPAGIGLEGTVQTIAGTVAVTAGSPVVSGIGTGWTPATNSGGYWYYVIRIEGTHSGTPFVFFASIGPGNTGNSMTLVRPWPADADTAAGLSYSIIAQGRRNFSAKWTRPDGSEGYTLMGTTACLSPTRLYWNGGAEAISGAQTAKTYGYLEKRWLTNRGVGSINFYDEVLANYAMYFRSGLKSALDAARAVGDYWLSQPDINDGWLSAAPRNMSVAGTVAGAVLDGRVQNWYGLRKLAVIGVGTATAANCNDDVRETAYQLMWLAFAAMFDPVDTGDPNTPNQRSYWRAKLDVAYARDAACKGSDNSFSSGFNFYYPRYPTLSVTAGSTAVTGTNFTAAMCPRIAGGTATVVNGNGVLTILAGTLAQGPKIVILGTLNGQPYTPSMQFTGLGASTTLSGLWAGDSGTVSWQVESDDSSTVISNQTTLSAANPGALVTCTFNSSTSLSLSRPWTGTTGIAYMDRGGLTGRGQQPFLAGIKTLQMKYASLGAAGSTAANYGNLATSLATWILEKGYDPSTGGLYYGRVFPNCEPILKASQPGFTYRNLWCDNGSANSDKAVGRALLAEAQTALRVAYEGAPSQQLREVGDQFYANLWGNPSFTKQGFTLAEGGITNEFAYSNSLSAGKWYGFQFGIGMAHQWPAVRLGGAQPLSIEQAFINVDIAGVDGAVKARLSVTAPSGRKVQYNCTATPCQVDIDRRQGDHWLLIEYLSSADLVIVGNDPTLLASTTSSQN